MKRSYVGRGSPSVGGGGGLNGVARDVTPTIHLCCAGFNVCKQARLIPVTVEMTPEEMRNPQHTAAVGRGVKDKADTSVPTPRQTG